MARDPQRIEPTLAALRDFWYRHPGWRLGQVVANASRESLGSADPFHMEDHELVEALDHIQRTEA